MTKQREDVRQGLNEEDDLAAGFAQSLTGAAHHARHIMLMKWACKNRTFALKFNPHQVYL